MFRGRGARHGARPPAWLLRLTGALLGLAIMQFAAALGVWSTVGLSPMMARFLLMVTGALLAVTGVGVALWIVSFGLAAMLLIVLYTPLVVPIAPLFVRRDVPVPSAPVPDAVVILSGTVSDEGLVNGAALERVLSGLREVQQRRIPAVAMSIIADERDARSATSERDQRELVELMAPHVAVSFVRDVFSTRDEALAFAALARTRQWRRVVLVTSPLHSRRACRAVEQAGLAVECRPATSRVYALSRLDRPETRRLVFSDVLYETAATLLYAARGWTR